jgi:hypothetical protein
MVHQRLNVVNFFMMTRRRPMGEETIYECDPSTGSGQASRLWTVSYPGGMSRAYTYDALMRLQSLTATDPGGTPLLNDQYTHDDVGNRLWAYRYEAEPTETGRNRRFRCKTKVLHS